MRDKTSEIDIVYAFKDIDLFLNESGLNEICSHTVLKNLVKTAKLLNY